jgi:preprotein translocase subunit SecD
MVDLDVRENWRVYLLVVVLAVSTFALFSPTFADSGGGNGVVDTTGPTNLKYGLELSGGTRVRAPLVGVTAEDVQWGNTSTGRVERAVAAQLDGAEVTDVIARPTTRTSGTVEVTADGVTPDQLGTAVEGAGLEYGTVRDGVTEETRETTVRVIQNKINQAGLSGGSVQTVTATTPQGVENLILIEVPNQNPSEVVDLVSERGTVRVDAYYQTQSGNYTRQTVLTQGDFQSIGTAQQAEGGNPPAVPVTITEERAGQFEQDMVETGVAQPGGSQCRFRTAPNNTDPCLLLVVDGEVVNAFGMTSSLAGSMIDRQWSQDPGFQLTTTNFTEAQEVAINLRAGALPARLAIGENGEGTTTFISPSQSEAFKTNSLITGIIAVLAVSIVVFIRYGRTEVAAPMVVTALSEVVILLGFAAGIGYPLDLSVIAGFIAVIGTGVDDLIIIADEVMSEGEVNSRRVFQSRFRKAFWVIGAAAATTIIAMSPLAVLSLGDLQGFAIFTILGVVAGVLLTRPAYGDILRTLLTRAFD